MTRGFNTSANNTMLAYMLENTRFTQRGMADELGWHFGQTVNSFVRWLEEFKHVRKTLDCETRKKIYEIKLGESLLGFYSTFRDMNKEKLVTHRIGRNYDKVRQYINDNGGIMCLSTALQFYDDYYRDPVIYAYAENRKLLEIIPNQEEGEIQVNLYAYDFVDETREEEGIRITSPTRTVMDLYCNNMAYAAEKLMVKM